VLWDSTLFAVTLLNALSPTTALLVVNEAGDVVKADAVAK